MALWRVFYEDWQMECCGTPFSVGERVDWRLLLLPAGDVLGGGWDRQVCRIEGTAEMPGGGDGTLRTVRAADGLVAALGEGTGVADGGRTRWEGVLLVEHHAGEWARTTGRVRALHLVRRPPEETRPGSRLSESAPAWRRLEEVTTCPRWFGPDTAGVLAVLDVPGAAPPEPRDRR
jgi:hypothetical protein